MSDNSDKLLLDAIDDSVKSLEGKNNYDAAEFLYAVTRKLNARNKGAYGIEGAASESYPVIYANKSRDYPENELPIFKDWFTYFAKDNIPRIYQRWALLSLAAALLEKNVYLQEGIDFIYPNIYVALVGDSGTGKTRTIKRVLEILKTMGYDKTTTATTTREKFVEDLENGFKPPKKAKKDFTMDEDIFGESDSGTHAGYILAEEWKDFFKSQGQGNEEWISLLEKAYDCPDTLDNRVKTGKGSSVKDPVLNMLGAVTPDGLNDFTRPKPFTDVPFSGRLFTIYGPSIPKKYREELFLDESEVGGGSPDDRNLKFQIVKQLNALREMKGKITWAPQVYALFEYVTCQTGNKHVDTQHTPYYNRRDLHLKKLCIILAAMSGKLVITKEILCHAESILLFAESFLPVAVGFPMYGYSDFSSKRIMQLLNRSHLVPVSELLDRVSAVIPDKEKFEKQKLTLISANRLQEVTLEIKNPLKSNPMQSGFYISKIMDYRLSSVIKTEKDAELYEYYFSITEIVEAWKHQIDIENDLGIVKGEEL